MVYSLPLMAHWDVCSGLDKVGVARSQRPRRPPSEHDASADWIMGPQTSHIKRTRITTEQHMDIQIPISLSMKYTSISIFTYTPRTQACVCLSAYPCSYSLNFASAYIHTPYVVYNEIRPVWTRWIRILKTESKDPAALTDASSCLGSTEAPDS